VHRVEKFEALSGLMNLARGCVRIVAVVSPTAPGADADLAAVLSSVRASSSKRLRAYVVITAASAEDTAIRAAEFAARHTAPRTVYLWDPTAVVAGRFGPVLGVEGKVHSVYLLYDTAAILGDSPPAPDTWMQDGPGSQNRFDARQLETRANELVRRVESKVAGAESEPR
jgi:hypothetical protein